MTYNVFGGTLNLA